MFFRVLRILAIVFRMPFALAGAYALLYVLSYGVVAPDSAREWEEGMTLYHLRGYLWVLPWLFTEFVCVIGPRRNLVWFSSMLTVLIGALIAWPVLTATQPELVYRMLPFQETGMLSVGVLYFSIILFTSVIVRLVFLAFLFTPPADEDVSGEVDATVLDPATARSVREIAANPVRPQPKFRFGDADEGVVQRFHALMRRLIFRRRGANVALLLALAALVAWFFLYPQPTEDEALQRDLVQLKQYQKFKGAAYSPLRSVCAAYRVMEYIDTHNSFEGKTKAEAEAWLGLDKEDAHHAAMRRESDLSVPSVDDAFESRERFLTVSTAFDFRLSGDNCELPRKAPTAILYIRTDESGDRINVVEIQDSGFNDVTDEQRHRMGTDWNRRALHR